jgi:hypothetical protein
VLTSEVAKATGTDYKTAKKYSNMSPQPKKAHPQVQTVQNNDATIRANPIYDQPRSYHRTVRVGSPRPTYDSYYDVRDVRASQPQYDPRDDIPRTYPTPPQTVVKPNATEKILQHEQQRFSSRKGVPVDTEQIREINRKRQEDAMAEAEKVKKDAELSNWIQELRQKREERHKTIMQQIDKNQVLASENRAKFDKDYWDNYYKKVPKKSEVLPVIKEEIQTLKQKDKASMKRKCEGLRAIAKMQDDFIIEQTHKKQNWKLVSDLTPDVANLVGNIYRSYQLVKNKTKKPVKKTLVAKARTIK